MKLPQVHRLPPIKLGSDEESADTGTISVSKTQSTKSKILTSKPVNKRVASLMKRQETQFSNCFDEYITNYDEEPRQLVSTEVQVESTYREPLLIHDQSFVDPNQVYRVKVKKVVKPQLSK